MARNDAAAKHLAEHLHEVPVLILCCLQHDGSPSDINRGASIYPAVQNMLLATPPRCCPWATLLHKTATAPPIAGP